MKKCKFYFIDLVLLCIGTLAFVISCTDDKWNPGTVDVTAEFDFSLNQENAPVLLSVNDKSTGGYTYYWTLTGATPNISFDKNPTVRYSKEGSYDIMLKVCNGTSCSEITKKVEIKAPLPVKVSAEFDYIIVDDNDYSPAQVIYNDKSVNPQTWNWLYEGGQPEFSNKQIPGAVIYSTGGKFQVSLTVTNEGLESKFIDSIKIYPGELVCKNISDEIWKADLIYSKMTIGTISMYLDKERKNEEEEQSKSVYEILILGAAMNIITNGKETNDLLFRVNSSWDWYTKDSKSLDMTIYYRGYKGSFTANILELDNSAMKLGETSFDPNFTQLINSVDASGTLLTLLSYPQTFAKTKP
jgi:PKD repeat protein